VKGALGWHAYQVRTDHAIRRHWALVCCAFTFCWWAGSRDRPAEAAAPPASADAAPPAPVGGNLPAALPAPPSRRPDVSWPVALRRIRAWLEPWIMLARYWRGWSAQPPPSPLQALLDWVGQGRPILLYDSS